MKEKQKLKDTKGITLVALVVTIIVLLILAAVSIAMLTGEHGIIAKARDAKENMESAEVEEKEILKDMEIYIEDIVGEGKEYAPYDKPYIPTGFEHTEGSWNSGYVIRNTSTKDEFVWVPCVLDQAKVRERRYSSNIW